MGGRGYGGGGRGRIYTYRYTVTTRMTCIKMGSDESHFNVSLTVRDKVSRQCPQTRTFEEKGEPKRIRTEVPPLTKPNALPLRHWRGTLYLRAAVQRRGQHSPKGSGTNNDCRSNLTPKHARKHETHPPLVRKSSISIGTIVVLFSLL